MVKQTVELINAINDFKSGCMAAIGGEGGLENLEYGQYQVMQKGMKLITVLNDTMLKQAAILDDINSKMDTLISKKERA